jgi:thiol:disulfide interchange protein
MPPSTPPAKPPTRRHKALWLAVAALVVIAAALAYFLASPTPAPPAQVTPPPAPAQAPAASRHIYPETADPKADIAAALAQAKRERKRVILDFGGDWCGDCQVLDIYFHQPPNDDLLARNFVVVHVWIGHMDANVDIPKKYGVPINKGVPALAVLAPSGAVLFAQKNGEFEKMRSMDASSVTEFLKQWKPSGTAQHS